MTNRERQIFDDVEEIVYANVKIENIRATFSDPYLTKAVHEYAKTLCKTILDDICIIKRRYEDEN